MAAGTKRRTPSAFLTRSSPARRALPGAGGGGGGDGDRALAGWRPPQRRSRVSFPARAARGKFLPRYFQDYGETRRVYARRILPAAARGRPRLLYLHGYLQPETFVEELALLTTMALQFDVEVVQMQLPYHGRRAPRVSRFSGEFYWTADLVRSFEALRQTLLDARTLLAWLLAEDARPVGVAGLSLGGTLTLTLACLEERFAFAVPIIAHMDLAALVSDAPVLTKMRHDLTAFGWRKQEFDDFARGVGWYELRPKLPADRVLMFAASEDRFFDPRVVRRLWKRWGQPAIH
jgi:Alpha/beta hydrolase domain containing 18